jgi:hypothetical protein
MIMLTLALTAQTYRIELRTSSTLKKNHTPRPLGHYQINSEACDPFFSLRANNIGPIVV